MILTFTLADIGTLVLIVGGVNAIVIAYLSKAFVPRKEAFDTFVSKPRCKDKRALLKAELSPKE